MAPERNERLESDEKKKTKTKEEIKNNSKSEGDQSLIKKRKNAKNKT